MTGEPGPLLRLVRDQRIAFLLVGVTNTLIGLLWFFVFYYLLLDRLGYMAMLLFTHFAAVLSAFVLYRRFVFQVRGHVVRDLGRFELINLTALGINAVLLPLFVEVWLVPVLLSQVIITGVNMFVSFFGHRGFSFRRTAKDHAKNEARQRRKLENQ